MMKKLLLASVLAIASTTAANAWTSRSGHWHEGPTLYGPINPGAVYAPYGVPPAYGYGYGAPVVVAPPPTDTQVIAGTILGIAGMAIDA
jgi:hypothetical protein